MAAPDSRFRLLTFGLALAMSACQGATPPPVARSEDSPPAIAAEGATPAPAPASEPAATAAASAASKPPPRDDAPVVVDPGDDNSAEVSLVDAAKAERERRSHAGEPVAVINDKTLPQYASKGQITVADPKTTEKKPASAPPPQDSTAVRDEQYWRGRALEIRLRWRQALDEVKELEQRSGELRQRFYAETDPFLRDTQIKPEWDRVLERLRQARLEADAAKGELAQLLDEGGSAGALPGWLREGEDQEPVEEPKKKETPRPAQSIEPPIVEPPATGGRGGWR